MLNRIVQPWNQFSPRIKFMFVGLLVPLIGMFLYITFKHYPPFNSLIGTLLFPFRKSIHNPPILLFVVVICGLLGFAYGSVYEQISPRNKILAWALTIIAPLVIYFSFFFISFLITVFLWFLLPA